MRIDEQGTQHDHAHAQKSTARPRVPHVCSTRRPESRAKEYFVRVQIGHLGPPDSSPCANPQAFQATRLSYTGWLMRVPEFVVGPP